ncbi:MAG: formate dehydrogenase [Proteobacteria bacterium]|nr:formate dehydrogenase [Pseudomonadota bacterium]MDE3209009.1 formate dehydrogenase [Pseudomonadota bacterium]
MTIKIYVPQDSASLSVGANEVAVEIEQEAHRRNEKITIVRNGSRGLLWLEPLVEVETPDGRVAYGPVEPSDVAGLFDAGFVSGGKHVLGHGLTENIPFLAKQERLTFARVGITSPLSIEDYIDHEGYRGLERAISLGSEGIVAEIGASGLRGRGGAAGRTGKKWQEVRASVSDVKYVVCNADEGDSGTYSDRMIMEGDPFVLIEGMTIAGIGVGAAQGYIYLRSEYPHAFDVLNAAIKIAYEKGYLGNNIRGSGFSFDLEVRRAAGAYICGEQTSLLESLEGKRGLVRYRPPQPAVSGFMGKPTLVNNVISLATVPIILDKGSAYYKDYGMGRSRGTLPIQLTGNVKQGGLIERAFGVTLREIIFEYGLGTKSGRSVRAVQVGGPLGAYIPESQFDVPLDYEKFSDISAVLGHGGIVVFDDTVDMAQQARYAMEFCAIESCGKCTPCRIGSQRGVEVIDKIIANNSRPRQIHLLRDLCTTMIDGSLCAMGGMTPFPVLSALNHFPEDFGAAAGDAKVANL